MEPEQSNAACPAPPEAGKRENNLQPRFSFRLLLGASLLFALSFPLVHSSLPRFGPFGVAAVCGALVFFLSLYDWQIRRLRRYFFIRNHLLAETRLASLLRGGVFLYLAGLVKGIFLSMTLLVGLLSSGWLLYLLLAVPLAVYLVRYWLYSLLKTAVAADYLVLLSETLTRWITLGLLVAIYTGIAFFLPQPDYLGVAWQDVISYQLYLATANTDFIEGLQAVSNLYTALFSWLVQNAMPEFESPWAMVLGWLLILTKGGLSLLPAINLALLLQHNSRH